MSVDPFEPLNHTRVPRRCFLEITILVKKIIIDQGDTLALLKIIVKNAKYQNLVGTFRQKLLKFPDYFDSNLNRSKMPLKSK